MTHRFRTIPKASTTARGYGYTHQQARKQWAAKHQPTDPCVRCHRPLGPMGPHLHLDHNHDRTGYLGFACGPCNRRAGAKAGNAASRPQRTPGPTDTTPYTRPHWQPPG